MISKFKTILTEFWVIWVILCLMIGACITPKPLDDLPLYTEVLVENSDRVKVSDCISVLCNEVVNKVEDDFVIESRTVCSIAESNNPTWVSEHYLHPLLMASAGLDIPDVAFDICAEPVKVVDKVTFGTGEVYDVEYWTYVVDYSKVREDLPVVILPVSTVVVYKDLQRRVVFNFTTPSPYSYSDMILAADSDINVDVIKQMQVDFNNTFEVLLLDVNTFFKHCLNFEQYINAEL